jgi:hypothetical protein
MVSLTLVHNLIADYRLGEDTATPVPRRDLLNKSIPGRKLTIFVESSRYFASNTGIQSNNQPNKKIPDVAIRYKRRGV